MIYKAKARTWEQSQVKVKSLDLTFTAKAKDLKIVLKDSLRPRTFITGDRGQSYMTYF